VPQYAGWPGDSLAKEALQWTIELVLHLLSETARTMTHLKCYVDRDESRADLKQSVRLSQFLSPPAGEVMGSTRTQGILGAGGLSGRSTDMSIGIRCGE